MTVDADSRYDKSCREKSSIFISCSFIMPPSLLFLLLFLLSSSVSLPPPRTSFLLSDDDGSTLFVGARDAVFSLDVTQSDVISLKRKVEWRPSQSEINECQIKGRTLRWTVLTSCCPLSGELVSPVRLRSFAFSPHDAFIVRESLKLTFISASVTLVVENNHNAESFSLVGLVDAKAKLRCPFSPLQRNSALTVGQSEQPAFVGSAAVDRKLFFFFTEDGKEFSFVDELRIARVAQVCKNKWTSFAKAPLLCQVPRQLPFNVLQHDVQAVFDGSYRTFDTQTHLWSSLLGKHSHLGQCGLDSATDSELSQVKKSFLTSGSVKSAGAPLVSSDQRYMVLLAGGPRVIEEIQVFTQPQIVKSIVLSSSKQLQSVCSGPRPSVWLEPDRKRLHSAGRQPSTHDLEDGNVKEQCRGETKAIRDTEVFAPVNEAVILPCEKPSQPSSLTWTSSLFTNLRQSHFLQSADGALSFIATAHTFGKVSEVIASFIVGPVSSPRAFSPVQKKEEDQVTKNEEHEPFEDIFPEVTKAEHVGDSKDETPEVFFSPTSRADLQSRSDDEEAAPRPALLVVSLLLALCVGLMILGGLLLWRRDARIKISRLLSPEEGGASNAAME
ncbi:hypothetical protein F7725_017786, partial [Dissostichus mawsoni]